ncbi:hypothetical protein [Microcoleus sp. Pol7_B2]|uniref:hypothetical protein n=1 Tax=Microcoleus sp. Pol7_B2 TaxID=2818895 RepID=UPI002FD23336
MNLFLLYLSSADTCFHALVGSRYIYSRILINLYFGVVPSEGCAIEHIGVYHAGAKAGTRRE